LGSWKAFEVWKELECPETWSDFGSLEGLERLESWESFDRLWKSKGFGKPGKLGGSRITKAGVEFSAKMLRKL
jgi:hypothetical protein